MNDPFDPQPFVTAQDPVFARVLSELREGRKRSHWIWFIFPQLKGLGYSWEANHFGIGSRAEAGAIEEIFGGIDAIKFRSSVTLFAQVGGDEKVFLISARRSRHLRR